MKISYRTHPILNKLNEGKLGVIGILPEDSGIQNCKELIEEMRNNFKDHVGYFKRNISVITKPFYEAIGMAKEKMLDDELFKLDKFESGTIVLPNGYTHLYSLYPFNTKTPGHHLIYTFYDNIFIGYSRQRTDEPNGLLCVVSNSVVKERTPMLQQHGITDKATIINEIDNQFTSLIMVVKNFIKYCPLEFVSLNPKAKSKEVLCKYINDTDCALNIYDSKWFTTFVKSDAFKVRGHFRLQACGEGLKDKKLIWINDFVKDGYTAPARKLSNS